MSITEAIYRVQLEADLEEEDDTFPEFDLEDDSEAREAAQRDIEQERLKEKQNGKS